MNKHLTNAAYGVLDYVSYPLGMLLVAPVVLRRLGAGEYGLWAVSTSAISIGGILASGFCDANIQRVARLRNSVSATDLSYTVRSMLGINLALGLLFGAVVWLAAPAASVRLEAAHRDQILSCLIVLRIASVGIVFRAIETVGVSTQRAFEEFGYPVRVNAAVRASTLGLAALLVLAGFHTVSILVETALLLAAGAMLQLGRARRLLGHTALWPVFEPNETRTLLAVGGFAWILALGGVIFNQADRLLLGISLGAASVAPYAICVQCAHPIFGVTASGLQFLFPNLAARVDSASVDELRQVILKAFVANAALVICGAGLLWLVGNRFIRMWAGADVARGAAPLLPLVILSSALMGLAVTGTYSLLAFGQFRTIAWLSLSSRALMLLLMVGLVRHDGVIGLACARVVYGLFALVLYAPLIRRLRTQSSAHRTPFKGLSDIPEVSEG